ncbi:MAG: translation initiation factor IF-6 [Candidatus Aenigmatarchaeota archaeon]
MSSIDKINFDGDVNLGLHTVVNDRFCLVDSSLSERCYEAIGNTLEVDVVRSLVANSKMVGIFSEGNSSGLVLPKNVETIETEKLDNKGIEYRVIDSKETALGNLILVNDSACLISTRLEDFKNELEDFFGVPVETGTVAGLDVVGSSAVATNRGLLCHRDVKKEEMEKLEELFDMICGRGTVNFGSPFVGAMITANSNGVLAGEKTTGPEMGRIDEALFPEE